MKKRILILVTMALFLGGCGKLNLQADKAEENATNSSVESDVEISGGDSEQEENLSHSDDSLLSNSVPDLYSDVFVKYSKEEDREKNTFEVVYADIKDSGYTIVGDPEETIAGMRNIFLKDDSKYYCGITFATEELNGDTENMTILAINFGHSGTGEISVNFESYLNIDQIVGSYSVLENGTRIEMESLEELDQYVKDKLVG